MKPSIKTSRVRKTPGKSGIICHSRMKRRTPTMSMTLRVPPSLYHRLHRAVEGFSTVAAWALIEHALNEYEADGQRWIIDLVEDEKIKSS